MEKSLLVIHFIDGHGHVPRKDWTRVHISIIFRYQIDIVKDKTLKIVFTGRVDKGGVHQHGFIVRSIARLFGDEDFIIEFLTLKNRMEIVK